MNTELEHFAARLRAWISTGNDPGRPTPTDPGPLDPPPDAVGGGATRPPAATGSSTPPGAVTGPGFEDFNDPALELFALQFRFNPAYQTLCVARRATPATVKHWTDIPAVPAAAFKELDWSCLPPGERTAVFHSSGTTDQRPGRHFHNAASLAVYEAALLAGFERGLGATGRLLFLTPGRAAAPHSSLIYMFDTLRRRRALPDSAFLGVAAGDGSWEVDFPAVLAQLESAVARNEPVTLLGTAFSLVHLLDHLGAQGLRLTLPTGSRVLETGGYKNRARSLPKAQLHALIGETLGVPARQIVCEYGMCELSSQAYAVMREEPPVTGQDGLAHPSSPITHHAAAPFHFPPWARVQIISPETGRAVAGDAPGLIRVLDLANVFSVAAIQTEDLGRRRGDGFTLLGRAVPADPRGCSLMSRPAAPARTAAGEKEPPVSQSADGAETWRVRPTDGLRVGEPAIPQTGKSAAHQPLPVTPPHP